MAKTSLRLGAAEGWVVTHDGETLKSGLQSDFEAVEWLHRRHGYSVDHAVRHEGYDVVFVRDGKVEYSYRREAMERGGSMGTHRSRGSEGTAYIDKQGGRWIVRWWSEDERRYYQVKTGSTLQEVKNWAEREGYKVVVAEPHNLGARRRRVPETAEVLVEYSNGIWRAKIAREHSFPRVIAESDSREEVLDAVHDQGYEPVFESPELEGPAMSGKHVLGLHTKDERKHAYGLVNEIYEHAMHARATSHEVQYALGYTEAVLDLARAEVPDDKEFMEALMWMWNSLLEKSAIPFSK